MDQKIRITFYPANASRVRFIVFSRRIGLVLLGLATLLSIVGFWLVLSGSLHEPPQKSTERKRLRSENMALRERVEGLESDAREVGKGLKQLEGAKAEALLATGIENANLGSDAGGIWNFFRKLPSHGSDIGASLARSRNIALFYDSTLVVLRNAQELSEALPTGSPVPRTSILTRGFGPTSDPFTGRRALHAGADFSDRLGVPVMATGSGEVAAVTKDPIWGICVRLKHRPGIETLYAHLATATVRVGQNLKRGDVLGTLGESGQSTGPHLHYELRLQGERVDPLRFLMPFEAGGHSI
jgi:murein DD-endopeptidase MepM/ murein hydrolase activator NlpD